MIRSTGPAEDAPATSAAPAPRSGTPAGPAVPSATDRSGTPLPAPAGPPPPGADPDEDALVLRVLGALMREDAAGLRSRSTVEDGWLTLPGGNGGAETLRVPVGPDGFQAELTARLPLLRRAGGADVTGCDAVLAALARHADPRDRAGWEAFAEECRRALEAMRLHRVRLPVTRAALAARHGADTADWHGHRGALAHDALAAFTDHPVHPASRGRAGFGERQLRAFAPEFLPVVRPRWVLLPHAAVTTSGGITGDPCWPAPARLGLPELEGSHVALPVHPMTRAGDLADALRAAGLQDAAVLARRPYLELLPTLSTRTGALAGDPARHLKLPLPTATLGRLNRRTIKPGTLADGAAGQALLAAVLAREPRFAGRILLADETRWAHAGHELLAVLLRVQPAGLDEAAVVPLAAPAAGAPDAAAGPRLPGGRHPLVTDQLARRFFGGDPAALLEAVLTLLFDWQTTLLEYGVALESHQQNVSLVLDRPDGGPTRVRLLLKDNDGPRVDPVRLGAALGGPLPEFTDPRVLTGGQGPLVDLFTTITVHLCAASWVFGLARAGRLPLSDGLALLRRTLGEAADRRDPATRDVLYRRVLDAERLPVKAMVTAGTLLTKERSGAADINKHYTDGPNYLRVTAGS